MKRRKETKTKKTILVSILIIVEVKNEDVSLHNLLKINFL